MYIYIYIYIKQTKQVLSSQKGDVKFSILIPLLKFLYWKIMCGL